MIRDKLKYYWCIYIGFVIVFAISLYYVVTEKLTSVPVIIGLVVAGIIVMFGRNFLDNLKEKAATQEQQVIAHQKNWKHNNKLNLPFFELFTKYLGIDTYHPLYSKYEGGITGKINGWSFVVFDGYYYPGGSGGGDYDSEPYYQTFFVLSIKDADFPLFGLEPETLTSKLHNVLAKFDIDFQSHPKFSKSFTLYGNEESRIRQIFNNDVLNFFEFQKGISVFAYKNHILMYSKKKRRRSTQIERRLEDLVHIAKLLLSNKQQTIQTNSAKSIKLNNPDRIHPSKRKKKVSAKSKVNYW